MSIAEKLIEVSENVSKVYEAGVKKGCSDVWDMIQNYGNRTQYDYAFSQWNVDNFYPKYDIVPSSANWFARGIQGTNTIDLVQRLAECGVKMDFSQCTNVTYLFYYSRFNHLPEIDCRNAGNTSSHPMFGANVVNIDKLIIKDDGSQCLSSTFGYAARLENIVIEGVIGAGSKNIGFDAQWSKKLSKESILSLVNALSDETDGATVTLSQEAVDNAFYDGTNIGSNSTVWLSLIESKQNWTISLI